jgi:type II secretory pathway component PulM
MGLGETLKRFWAERSARERAVLLGGAAFVAAAALYAFLWEPGLAARRTLAVALPTMRAQLEDMRAQQKEILGLRKSGMAAAPTTDLRALLRASLERSPLSRAVERVESRSGDQVLINASAAPFDLWLDWLRSVQTEFGVRVEACEIRALGQPGMVRIEATLARGAT